MNVRRSAILALRHGSESSFIRKLIVSPSRVTSSIIVSTLGRNGSIHLGRPPEQDLPCVISTFLL